MVFRYTLIILSFISLISCSPQETKPELFLPDDLEARLWAESPMFYNPTNMDVDSRGRIWITEAVNYRNFNNDSTHFLHHNKGDRIMILEDTNGDGKADLSKVFVEDKDLLSPLGIAVIGNKIFVSSAPNLIVYTDSNGDDIPDSKEIFLTGFGGKDHDHSLHSLVAGPDGNYYFNVGNAGPHIVADKAGWTLRSGSLYAGGTPYNLVNHGNMKSDDGRVWVGGLALRIKPDGTNLSVLGHNFRNSYEVAIDSYGNLWQNDNDDQVVACRTSWLMEGGNAGYFSSDGTRYWQADQRPWQDVFSAHWHQDDPGVMPAGDNMGAGSPTGVVVNESDALGVAYRGMMLSAEAGRNVIFSYHPSVKGSGYDLGKRINFITSLSQDNTNYVWNDSAQNSNTSKWFRPSDISIGTDGALYIADWHDPVVGGHQMKDSIGYGRIYRVAPKNKKLSNPVINYSTVAGQLEALKNPAINVRNLAFEKLKQQGAKNVDAVKTLLNDPNPYIQARAIWLLSQLGSEGLLETKKLIDDNNVELRVSAFRALRQAENDILPIAEKLANDESAFVRREVLISLRDLPTEKIKPIWTKIAAKYDGTDRWYLEALGQAAEGREEEFYAAIKKMLQGANKKPEQWSKPLASITWRLHPASATQDLLIRANSESLTMNDRLESVTALAFISKKESVQAMISLAKNKNTTIAEQASYWLAFRQGNDWALLADWTNTEVDAKYELKVASMKVKKGMLLDEHQSFYERSSNAQAMAKDEVGGQMLLTLAEEGKLARDLYPAIEELIFNNPDVGVRIQASNYFKRSGSKTLSSIPAMLKIKGNPNDGEVLFAKNCMTCHSIKGKGKNIGPDLTHIQQKFDRAELLDAIVNPSGGIVFGYESWLIKTNTDKQYFGFIVAENDQSITVKDLAGKSSTILMSSITSRSKQSKSLMPDPASLALTEQNLVDVMEYLLTLK